MSAFDFLWNRHDVDVGHKRRYTKSSIKRLLEENGYHILYAKYFFISIMPLLVMRALINRPKPDHIPRGDRIPQISPILNKILSLIMTIENKILDYMPNIFGGSIMLVAQKR